MGSINYNYNYENRSTSTQSIVWSNAEITNCTYAQMQASTPENGYFYHTTDTGKFYFAWGGEYIELNVTGDSDISALVSQAQQALNDANAAVSAATSAATAAQNAAEAVSANAAHFTDTTIHITSSERDVWNAKQDALTGDQISAIAAVSGKQDKFTNESVLSGITASQVSSWEAVAAGSYDVSGTAASVLVSAKSYTDTQISGLNWVKSVNGANGDVTVRTFTLIDDDRINVGGTVKEFCDDLYNVLNPAAGTAYLAEVYFVKKNTGDEGYDEFNAYNNIGMPDTLGNGELIIYVPVEGVYELEMHSTNGFDKDYSISGKWMTMYDGSSVLSPWKGFMTASFEETTSDGYQYVAHNDADGISKYYLEHIYSPLTSTQVSTLSAISTNASVLSSISQADIDNWNNDATGVSANFVTSTIASSLVGYATESYVDNAITGVSVGVSQGYVDDAIANISVGVSQGYVDDAIAGVSVGVSEEYVTSTIASSLVGYAKTSEIPSLSGYATESYVDTAIAGISVGVSQGYVDDAIANISVGVSQGYVDDAIAGISVGVSQGYVDNSISTATSDMATQTWVGDQGFLTSHQSLTDYVKASDVATVSLPTSSITSNWETSLPTLSENGDKYVTANDVIAFIQDAILKKKSDEVVTDDSDYLYISGYTEGSTATIINQMNKFKIELTDNTYSVEVVSPAEGEFLAGDHDEYIRFNFSVPSGYTLTKFELDDALLGLVDQAYTNNGSVTYNNDSKSYINYSRTPDNDDELLEGGLKYKITITKNS